MSCIKRSSRDTVFCRHSPRLVEKAGNHDTEPYDGYELPVGLTLQSVKKKNSYLQLLLMVILQALRNVSSQEID